MLRHIDGLPDPARAARLRDAVALARATTGDLTFTRLAVWQAVVLGVTGIGFRTGDAYAKQGRERYALAADTRARFDDCLAEATDPSIPLPSRAARVYLDVAFVHPFPDGNARAAMLCLDHVLNRERVRLRLATPALVIPRRPGDLPGTMDFIRLITLLIDSR